VAEPRPSAENALEVSASAIERLRSSLPRNERPKAEPRHDVVTTTENVPLSPAPNGANGAYPHHHAPEQHAAPPKATNGSAQPDAGMETLKGPRLDFLFRSKAARPGQPENFDALWPKRPPKGGSQGRQDMERSPPPYNERPAGSDARQPVESPPVQRGEEPRSVGILKSGVVDGMAYTLYADGSIEAQLPQGTVRFGSIAELRAHIENNP